MKTCPKCRGAQDYEATSKGIHACQCDPEEEDPADEHQMEILDLDNLPGMWDKSDFTGGQYDQ